MEIKEDKNYRSIFKALGLFGGVQVAVILFSILRTKVIAVSVGTSGVGEIGLYTTAIVLFFSVFNLGISSSSVKLISENFTSIKNEMFLKSVFVLNKLTLITAIIGFLVFLAFSPVLSLMSFGNYEYIWAFIFLSVVIFLESYNSRNLAILQGTRDLKGLGKVTVYGSVLGTLFSVPLYITFKVNAIVPSIVILYLSNFVVSQFFSKKIHLTIAKYTFSETRSIFRSYILLGIAMTISSILVYVVSYLIRLYLAAEGGLNVVGLYQAGWAIVTGYVGLIFTAMSKDYFPRLASVNENNTQVAKIANQQIEIGLLIISPIIMIFMVFINQIVTVLYSSEFLLIKNMMIWSLIGMFFKLLSWSISYIFLAKGLSKHFIIYEILGNVFTLIISILGYQYYGLEGLGFAFLATNIFYLIIVYYFSKFVFDYKFSIESIRYFFVNIAFCVSAALLIRVDLHLNVYITYCLLFICGVFISCYSLFNLEKKLKIFQIVKSKFKSI